MCDRPTTEEVVRMARLGDRAAFDRLLQPLLPELQAFAASRLGWKVKLQVEPDDIVQESLLKAFERFHIFSYRGDESLKRWVFAIAEHLIRNASRKRSIAVGPISLGLPSREPSPSRGLRREERFDRLHHALLSLSPDHQRVVELARIEGLKIHEIAERLGRSEGAVKKLLARALDALRERLGDTESLGLPNRQLGPGDPGHG